MAVKPEQLLHNLEPYLPTDRFRALLAEQDLAELSSGAAMFVDVSGFTPLTVRLVQEYGPQRASEELKSRLNPMFEAIGGLVFNHGGSVIRFVGDGFTAWFPDELPHQSAIPQPLPGFIRATIAGIEMLNMMKFFRELDVKVAVNAGNARRWVVGEPRLGLVDILAGPAVEGVAEISNRCDKHEVRTSAHNAPALQGYPDIQHTTTPDGDLLLLSCSEALIQQSIAHRWQAWQAGGDMQRVLDRVKQFIDPLTQEQETEGLGGISGELRYATPVFLRFTGIDYDNDPQARHKLDAYVRDVQNTLDETKGRLVSIEVADKGSVIFAVYGAPIAYGDDSRRAIHAVLTFRDLPQIHPAIMGQNIGVSRGLLYSGTVGGEVRHEYTSLGDETNVASRLMTADQDGKICISQAVYEDCSDWFEFEPGQAISPKGRVGVVNTFIPIRVKQKIQRDMRKNPIVGREAELGIAQKALDNVSKGVPYILRIEGAAGIGKSRLAAEIRHRSTHKQHHIANGFCLSTGRSIAFLPWRGLIRSLMDIDDEWSASVVATHLLSWITQRNKEWVARLPLLGDLLGIDLKDNTTTRNLTGSARQQALFSLVIDMLYYVASQKPLTLIIEDTHWLDEVSEALIIEVSTRLSVEEAAFLLVLLHRPATESEHPPRLLEVLNGLAIHQHLPLNELSQDAIAQLLADRMGGIIPPELTEFVYTKTQGNPFFVQEIIGALEEKDIIKRVGPRVYIEDALDKFDMPQTVQGLILARIDNLAESEKIVLKMAAVIGNRFEIRLLYQSLPFAINPEVVMQHLQNLEKRQFIYVESLYPEPIYAFRHAITQEVTYQTLLYDQRRQWHHAVGMVLERLTPESWERLAYHFSQTDDNERAYVYLVHAGDRAAHEFANQAALNYWGKALALARSRKEKFDLLCKRLELLMRTADISATVADLQQIIELAESTPNNLNWQVRKRRYQAEHELNQGKWASARDYAEEAIKLSADYQDLQLTWELYAILLRVYTDLDEHKLKQQATHHLRQIANRLNEPGKGLRLVLTDLLDVAQEDPNSGLRGLNILYQQEIASLDDPTLEANYWNAVSTITLQNRLLSQAEAALRTQLRFWRQIGNRRMEGTTLLNLGIALYHLGQYSAASASLRDSFTITSQVNDRLGEAYTLLYLGALAFRRNAFGEASAYIDRALESFEAVGALNGAVRALYFLGHIALAQKQYTEAQPWLRRALQLAHQISSPADIPALELALAYTNANGFTLPLPEEFQNAIDALEARSFHLFHDPDIAFWQTYYLLRFFKLEVSPLKQGFTAFMQSHFADLNTDAERKAFLDIGYTRELISLLAMPYIHLPKQV